MTQLEQFQIRLNEREKDRETADTYAFYSLAIAVLVLLIALFTRWKNAFYISLFFFCCFMIIIIIWGHADDDIEELEKAIKRANRRKITGIRKQAYQQHSSPVIVDETPTPPDCEYCPIYREEDNYVICPECGKFF